MRRLLILILILLLTTTLTGCYLIGIPIERNINQKDKDYIKDVTKADFQNSCKYNLYLYQNVAIKHIGIPIVIDYEELGQIAVDEITYFDYKGENLDGVDININDILYKWTYENPEQENSGVHVKTYDLSISTNKDYRFSAQPRIINQVIFRIYDYEYIIPIEIKIHDKKDYMGIYHNFKKVSIYSEPVGIEIPALNEKWEHYGQNFVVKDFFAADEYYNLTLTRFKKLSQTTTDTGQTRNVIKPINKADMTNVYIDDYVYMEIDLKPNQKTQKVICSGDMFILQLQNPQTNTLTDFVWGLYSRIDFCEANNLINDYFRYINSLPTRAAKISSTL